MTLKALFYNLVSPSRINDAQLSNAIDRIKAFHHLLNPAVDSLEVIGHGAGSFRHYPMNYQAGHRLTGGKKGMVHGNHYLCSAAQAKPIAELMEQAFREYQLDAVEIDVHLPDGNHALADCYGYVIHDKLRWDKIQPHDAAYNYLQQNRLDKVLSHFINQGFYRSKVLYLDLKVDADCQILPETACSISNHRCHHYPRAIANIVKPFLSGEYQSDSGEPWLRLVSFSPHTLSSLYKHLHENERNNLSFGVIAGYQNRWIWPFKGIKKYAANSKGPVPLLDNGFLAFIEQTPWLDRVWFSTKGLDNPVTIFQSVNKTRAGSGYSALKYSVAHYDVKPKSYRKKLSNVGHDAALDIVSFMVDIDRQAD